VKRSNEASLAHRNLRSQYWNSIARQRKGWSGWGDYYHRRLAQVYRHLVPPGETVLEIGCGQGHLLAALRPRLGVGVDFSEEMVKRARELHPSLHFIRADAHELYLDGKFDVILVSDLVNELWDIQRVFEQLSHLATRRTRIIINFYSRLWELPLAAARKLRLATPTLDQNWLTVEDISTLLNLANLEVVTQSEEILWPLHTPLVATFFNRFLVRIWPFMHGALSHLVVARPRSLNHAGAEKPVVSVVIPVRNEAGNIDQIFERIPQMGRLTELVFVEGHSTDNTYSVVQKAIAEHAELQCKLFRQKGEGKGDAVRLGFAKASGDILMILDADLTVQPEDLPRFFEVLVSGKGEFANGVRLVYPMVDKAMRFFNLLGNKFFSLAFSWVLGQPIKDTMCGTKALWKGDYDRIAANRIYFGDFDPFGDFDLLLGAAKLQLKIVEVPIRYQARMYGTTKMQRWRGGWILLKMVVFTARRLKFI